MRLRSPLLELDDPEGGRPSATEGPFAPRLQRARSRAWSPGPPSLTATPRARVLRLPALYFMALWLKDAVGDRDLIVPLELAPPASKRAGVTTAELFGELRERARSRLENADDEAG